MTANQKFWDTDLDNSIAEVSRTLLLLLFLIWLLHGMREERKQVGVYILYFLQLPLIGIITSNLA